MPTRTRCRRTTRRFSMTSGEAQIEVELPPGSGRRESCVLVDLSSAGLSFMFSEEFVGIDSGTNLDGAVITVAGQEIRGDMLVMHVTESRAGKMTCGALFYPSSDEDLMALRGLVAQVKATQRG